MVSLSVRLTARQTSHPFQKEETQSGHRSGRQLVRDQEQGEFYMERTRGTRLVLFSITEQLTGRTVHHSTDNGNVEHIFEVDSAKPNLHPEAFAIYTLCRQYNIHLRPEWKHMLSPGRRIGKATCLTQFSTFWTRQVSCFCIPCLNPCSDIVWMPSNVAGQEKIFGFSLPHLISRVSKHTDHGIEKRMIVIPAWASALWWSLIITNGRHPKHLC